MKIKVGISSCLLGNEVRFDGGHKHSRLCTEILSHYFDFVPECPELAIGLGVPRQPIQLLVNKPLPRLVAVHDHRIDYTEKMTAFSQQQSLQLTELCGYIFIEKSPSCGVYSTKVFDQNGEVTTELGRGMYAQILMDANPLLPVEEANRLRDSALRANFITRVFAYDKWQNLKQQGLTYQAIMAFHSSYKYCLMAQSPADYAELGRMLADAGNHQIDELAEHYFSTLMTALAKLATRKSHANVLMHLQGYLKKSLGPEEKHVLTQLIEQYRTEQVPLSVPVKALNECFNQHPDLYIAKQVYLQIFPDEVIIPTSKLS